MRAVLHIKPQPYYRRNAFEQGLKRVGFTLADRLTRPDGPEDWKIVWNRQGAEEVACDEWERHGGTVVVVENGYLQKIDKTMYAVSVHGHCGSGWIPVGHEDRFTKLGFHAKPFPARTEGFVLVCAQRGIGSREMRSPPRWGENHAAKIPGSRLRNHPGNFAPKVPLVRDLMQARECHVWSSAAGVQALVEGVPVKHHAPHWICEGGGESELARAMALHRMSHGQWHFDEIATGEPFARVIEQREKAVW